MVIENSKIENKKKVSQNKQTQNQNHNNKNYNNKNLSSKTTMPKFNFFLFGMSLLANSGVHAVGMLRGRNLDESLSAPTCEEVDSNPTPFYCRQDCGTEYWQCVNGEVIAQPMPEGSFCHNGDYDISGICNERDSRCDAIEALNRDDKIMCSSDCSDNYLACSNGKVISMPMAEGTRCYHNGIVRLDEGHCIIEEEVISYFELLDACMNYPDLEHCASTADPTSPPYKGAEFEDGAWYFVDKVWYSYASTYSRENGKGWDININIRFGHDQEVGRSRSIVASIDYGATEIRKWTQYDLVDGDEEGIHYNCLSEVPEEPTTHFVAQLIKNPAIIFEFGKGQFDLLDDDDVHEYTAQVTIAASELGEDFEGEGDVEILVESVDAASEETPDDAEPVMTPTFLFRNVQVYEDDSAYAEDGNQDSEGFEGFEDVEDDVEEIEEDDSNLQSMEDVRSLFDVYFNVTLNETVCSTSFEPIHLDEPNTLARVSQRGKLTAGTGENDDGTSGETIEQGTEEMTDQLDPIARKLMQIANKRKQESFSIPQDTISDCKDGEVLVDHCCYEDIHFLSCSPTQDGQECASGSVSSSRCTEIESAKDIIVEPRFLKGNVPMQLHAAEHLESLQLDLDDVLIEPEPIDRSERQLYWRDDLELKLWVHRDEEDFTSATNLFPSVRKELRKITKWTSGSRPDDADADVEETEETAQDLWDNFSDLFLGRGGGLPNVKDLLSDLSDLDETLSNFYEFTTDLEGDMLTVFNLMHNVDRAETGLQGIDDTLKKLHRVLKLVQIIKYVKPIAKPIEKTIEMTRKNAIVPALSKLNKVRDSITEKYKPKVERAMIKNEELRGVLAKAKFLNQNLMIVPFNTTRNCKPSDDVAKVMNSAVDFAKIDTAWAFDELYDFKIAMDDLVVDLSGVRHLVDEVIEAIKKMADVTNPISNVMNPFYIALSTRITIPILGPFCHKYVTINVPYPCGVKRCRRCRRIFRRKRCFSYPCGTKKCHYRKRVRVNLLCKKKFSFNVNQVLNGLSGVMDIIFYPINKAVDELLKAIPIPPIPLLPPFPVDLGAFDIMDKIGFLLEGPKFPTDLLDFPDVNLALPGLEDIVCGKSAGDLLEVFEMSKNGDITPEFIRDFYDGCGGWQDLNPVCVSTHELLCGDGGCPTESPSSAPTVTASIAPTVTASIAPSAAPSIAPTASTSAVPTSTDSIAPTVTASIAPSAAPSIAPTASTSAVPTSTDSIAPTVTASIAPSSAPSIAPTASTSAVPTSTDSIAPTVVASNFPSVKPSTEPTVAPTIAKSAEPTVAPTVLPEDPNSISV